MSNPQIIYDFNKNAKLTDWQIVDDVVMGGQSNGQFKINKDGHGEFSGYVSLENNGGFSSVRCNLEKISANKNNQLVLKVKGDKKNLPNQIKR